MHDKVETRLENLKTNKGLCQIILKSKPKCRSYGPDNLNLWHLPLEKKIFEGFTIYGRGGHLGHVTQIPLANIRPPVPWKLHMKFRFNQPSGLRWEYVWKC